MASEMTDEPTRVTAISEGQAAAPVVIDAQHLIRIAAVIREVLSEVKQIQPEPGAVEHLRRVHDRVCHQLEHALPAELYEELSELTPDVEAGTIGSLVLTHAEILGWLEGLFQAVQLVLTQAKGPGEPAPELPVGPDRSNPSYL